MGSEILVDNWDIYLDEAGLPVSSPKADLSSTSDGSTERGVNQKNKARENFTKKALLQHVSPQLCQCLLS